MPIPEIEFCKNIWWFQGVCLPLHHQNEVELFKLDGMTEVKTIDGKVLFSFDEDERTLAKEIGWHKELSGADLSGADLAFADLRYSNLSGADLSGADLAFADLKGANVECTNFKDADIEYADLDGAFGMPYIPLACPSEGSFIAWKKVGIGYLVKLEIPEDARRSSATSKKCRCSKALVLDIEDLYTGEHPSMVVNYDYCECVYEVGKMVHPDSFDENRWNECSHGIHFFMDKQDAIEY